MLVICKNSENPSDTFVISPPEILSKGTYIMYRDFCYIIERITYNESTGIIEYLVKKEGINPEADMESLVISFYKENDKSKLQTTKFVKDNFRWGLKESKDYVDELIEKYKL